MVLLRIAGSPEVLAQAPTDGRRDQIHWQVNHTTPLGAEPQAGRLCKLLGMGDGDTLREYTLWASENGQPVEALDWGASLDDLEQRRQAQLDEVWVEAPEGYNAAGGGAALPPAEAPPTEIVELVLRDGDAGLGIEWEQPVTGPAWVRDLDPGGAAERAGLVVGARLISANGIPLSEASQLDTETVLGAAGGRRVAIEYEPPLFLTAYPGEEGLGLGYDVLNHEDGTGGVGVVIADLKPGGACEAAGLPLGGLILVVAGRRVRGLGDLHDALQEWRAAGEGGLEFWCVPPPASAGDAAGTSSAEVAALVRDLRGMMNSSDGADPQWEDGWGDAALPPGGQRDWWEDVDGSTEASWRTGRLPPPPRPAGGWDGPRSPLRDRLGPAAAFVPPDARWPQWRDAVAWRNLLPQPRPAVTAHHHGGGRVSGAWGPTPDAGAEAHLIEQRDGTRPQLQRPEQQYWDTEAGQHAHPHPTLYQHQGQGVVATRQQVERTAPVWWGRGVQPRHRRLASCRAPDREVPPQRPPQFVTAPVPAPRLRKHGAAPCVVAHYADAEPERVQHKRAVHGYRGVCFVPGSGHYEPCALHGHGGSTSGAEQGAAAAIAAGVGPRRAPKVLTF